MGEGGVNVGGRANGGGCGAFVEIGAGDSGVVVRGFGFSFHLLVAIALLAWSSARVHFGG
jgi:hypothetical protein